MSGRTDQGPIGKRYRGFGLTIDSTLAIPGALDCDQPENAVDLRIRVGSVPQHASLADHPPYRIGADWLELTVPRIGTFALADRCDLLIAPAPAAAAGDVAALLVASGLAMALWARGGLLLHAAAFTAGPGLPALAIAGPSAAGKSLLLRNLVDRGAHGLADDSLWLNPEQQGPEQQGTGLQGPGLQEIVATGLPGGCFVRQPGKSERVFHRFAPQQCELSAKLGCLVILSGPAANPTPLRLEGSAAITAVLSHRHRPTAARLLGRDQAALNLAALLCREVPIYALGLDPERPEPALAALLGLLQTTNQLAGKM